MYFEQLEVTLKSKQPILFVPGTSVFKSRQAVLDKDKGDSFYGSPPKTICRMFGGSSDPKANKLQPNTAARFAVAKMSILCELYRQGKQTKRAFILQSPEPV